MDTTKQPLYLGAAYYPEDWDASEIPEDIRKMKEAGLNVVRMGEFAWSKMEPEPGKYDFGWLHDVVDRLADAGIRTILGTPTATPPIWLSRMYPDVLTEYESGRRAVHGGRRHCCSNNPHYREYARRITREMAASFARDPHVMGWQVDNEIYAWNGGCYCPECLRAFHAYLRREYGTVEAINRAWNLNLFSQRYDSIDEIPPPRDAWHNPHLRMEWLIFQNRSHLEFVKMQADILREYTAAPIGTDMMPVNGLDYEEMAQVMDVMQFNHYHTREDLWSAAFWFDFIRPLKERPFWNTETAACWNGSTEIAQNIKPEGFCRVNSLLPVALGGEANLYWLWRTHSAGHELVHGALLYPSGRPYHILNEVRQTAADLREARDFIRGTKVQTQVALHFTSRNWNMFLAQSVLSGFDYPSSVIQDIYRPLVEAGYRPDVIGKSADLSRYKVLFSPFMLTLEDGDLPERIAAWVKAGGTWVAGPMTDIRNRVGANYTHAPFGMLEELTGVRGLYQIPDREGYLQASWKDGETFTGGKIYSVFADDPDALVRLTEGHSALVGKPILLKKSVGKGSVILLGTVPSPEDMRKIIDMACGGQGLVPLRLQGKIVAVPRKGEGIEGLILMECGGEAGACDLPAPMRDILTGKQYDGRVSLSPYEVLMLEK